MRQSPSLGIRPRLPVAIRWVDGEPKIIAGGVPVVPFNAALRYRARNEGATRKSLAGYARAGALYATYCAHQQVGLLDVANEEFPKFIDGLLGLKFRNASGGLVHLDGHVRSRGSADLFATLLYSLTGDVAHLYNVSFDWRRYRRVVGSGDGLTAVARAHLLTGLGQRVHRIRHMARKVCCTGTSRSCLCMRYAGARRSDVAPIRIDHVDRQRHHLELEIKGHRKGDVELRTALPLGLQSEAPIAGCQILALQLDGPSKHLLEFLVGKTYPSLIGRGRHDRPVVSELHPQLVGYLRVQDDGKVACADNSSTRATGLRN